MNDIIYSKGNTHVENSYLITNRNEIIKEVDYIIEVRKGMKYPTRSINSYVNEWVGHNRLYERGIKQDHTKDVDLEEPQSLFWRIIWLIIGGI